MDATDDMGPIVIDLTKSPTPEDLSDGFTTPADALVNDRNGGPKRKVSDPLQEVRPTRRRAAEHTKEDRICDRCRSLDLKEAINPNPEALRRYDRLRGKAVADLGNLSSSNSTRSCALCRMFAAVAIPFPGEKDRVYKLCAWSMLEDSPNIRWKSCPLELKARDQPFLAVISSRGYPNFPISFEQVGQILCQDVRKVQTNLFSPQIIPPLIDYSRIQRWLDYCNLNHKKLCSIGRVQKENFKVIDCSSRSVVDATSVCRYSALSYVWGRLQEATEERPKMSETQSSSLSPHLPQVIEDAITVTQKLGLQYLWVDRLCIDQSDEAEKHNQISRMDSIYNGADITLIAAAGHNEHFGLPGVSTIPRKTQLTARVGDLELICTMRHPHTAIRDSKWYTRGWTLQEAVLSRKRLVFTEDQVYFECNAMNCCEALHVDLDALHTKTKEKSLLMLHNGVLSGTGGIREGFSPIDACNRSLKDSLARYYHLITLYTARNLTFDEDSYMAFAGIARSIAHSKFPNFHIAGLPVPALTSLSRHNDITVEKISAAQRFWVMSLLWVHSYRRGLDPRVLYRRPRFPSWSWAGWAGEVQFIAQNEDSFESCLSNVFFEYETSGLVEQRSLLSNAGFDDLSSRFPLSIHFEAWILPLNLVSLFRIKSWPVPSPSGVMEETELLMVGLLDFADLYLSKPKGNRYFLRMLEERQWKLMLISRTEAPYPQMFVKFFELIFMVVEQQMRFVTRVGIFRINVGEDHAMNSIEQCEMQKITLV